MPSPDPLDPLDPPDPQKSAPKWIRGLHVTATILCFGVLTVVVVCGSFSIFFIDPSEIWGLYFGR